MVSMPVVKSMEMVGKIPAGVLSKSRTAAIKCKFSRAIITRPTHGSPPMTIHARLRIAPWSFMVSRWFSGCPIIACSNVR